MALLQKGVVQLGVVELGAVQIGVDLSLDFLTYIFNVSENTVIIHLDYGDMAV